MKKYIKPNTRIIELDTENIMDNIIVGSVEVQTPLGKRNKDVDWDFEDEDF